LKLIISEDYVLQRFDHPGPLNAIENRDADYHWWLHQILDFLAGLTDNDAQQLNREMALKTGIIESFMKPPVSIPPTAR